MLFLAINQPLADGGPPAPEGIVDHLAWIDHGLATGVIETAGRWGTGGVVLLHATDHAAADDYLAGDPLVQTEQVTYETALYTPHRDR